MAQAALRHILFGLAASGFLMGCVQGSGTTTPATPDTPATARATASGDVEAPEVFQATDSALWDGRPSLGGIWVASPDVKDPERVVMFNPATGKTVTGALFRRERENPGPRLQISSDAAEALGILAGQPVEIKVTALRRVDAASAPDALPPVADAAAATVADASTDPAADAAADSGAAATAAAATAALAATGADGAAAVIDNAAGATVAATAVEAAPTEAPKRKTWKERRAEAKAAREAKKAAAAAAAAGVAVDGSAAPMAEEVPATADAVAVTAIESAPLDSAPSADPAATAAEPAAQPVAQPVAEPPKTRRQRRAEEAAAEAAAAAAATAPPTTEAPAVAPVGRPIQVASFTKETNADRAVEALAKIGITSQTRKSETGGKVVWGVVTTGDETQLNAIKGFGFADAFFLK